MRKVLGATRLQLMVQYLGESLLTVGMALVLGLMLTELSLPVFSAILNLQLDVDYSAVSSYLNLLGLCLLVALVGGMYPALILSAYKPATIMQARQDSRDGKTISLRSALVVFQFGICIALIIATSVIYLQVQYVSKKDPGYEKSNLIIINDLFNRAEVAEKKHLLRQVVEDLPAVSNVSLSGYRPASSTIFSRMSSAHVLEGKPAESFILANTFVDENYFQTYGMKLQVGRNFSLQQDKPAINGVPGTTIADVVPGTVILNEAAVKLLGFANPQDAIGQVFDEPSQFPEVTYPLTVIGVVSDTQFYSLRARPRPEIYSFHPYTTDVMAVSYEGSAELMMSSLSTAWRTVMGDAEFSADFLEPLVEQEFAQERREGQMFIAFSLFAIFIACLGLYGSAAFTVERRTQEIGIRKVMGAEISEIVSLLVWQFSKPVLLANLLAWPCALWAMLTWLQRFPYQIDTMLLIPLCVLAGAIALSIAWLTVIGNTLRVASTLPVLALRYE